MITTHEFLGHKLRQRNDNGFYCAADVVAVITDWRTSNGKGPFNFTAWMNSNELRFIRKLSEGGKSPIFKEGVGKPTWLNSFLMMDLLRELPDEIRVYGYKWLVNRIKSV